jgi:hypothetical protein
MAAIVRFSAVYAAIVFAFGFVLGVLRVLFLIPVIGEMAAVVVEVPIMLSLSYLISGRLVARFSSLSTGQGIEIGLLSFLLLQLAESLLGGFFGPYSYLDNVLVYWGSLTPPRLVGLIAQILFALLPLLHIWRLPPHERS